MSAVGILRTCATARPQLAKADTAFQAHPLGQPTEPCLGARRRSKRLHERSVGRRSTNSVSKHSRGRKCCGWSQEVVRTPPAASDFIFIFQREVCAAVASFRARHHLAKPLFFGNNSTNQ